MKASSHLRAHARPLQVLLLLLGLGAALPPLGGCSRQRSDDCSDPDRVVDPVLLAFLSHARSAHHLADQREAQGDVPAAIAALTAVTRGPAPPGSAPEVAEVLADTRARLADLLSRSGRFDEAAAEIAQGLVNAPEPNYFRGHLFEVRGLVEERREKALRTEGRLRDADEARVSSLEAYEQAMRVQAAVIEKAAPSATPAPSRTAPPQR